MMNLIHQHQFILIFLLIYLHFIYPCDDFILIFHHFYLNANFPLVFNYVNLPGLSHEAIFIFTSVLRPFDIYAPPYYLFHLIYLLPNHTFDSHKFQILFYRNQ